MENHYILYKNESNIDINHNKMDNPTTFTESNIDKKNINEKDISTISLINSLLTGNPNNTDFELLQKNFKEALEFKCLD